MNQKLILYVVAGPNGAGKTTFAKRFLPHYARCRNFINPDLIAGDSRKACRTCFNCIALSSTRCISSTIPAEYRN
jgi:predicted ABC-type ATPase